MTKPSQRQLGIIESNEKIELFFGSIPKGKILDDKQARYLNEIIDDIDNLQKTGDGKRIHRWQEFLACYELLKHEKGCNPTEREAADKLGLQDGRIRENNWLSTLKEKGYEASFNPREDRTLAARSAIRKAHVSMKNPTVPRIARMTGMSETTVSDHVHNMRSA
jgi:hypothetical protein